VSIITKTQSLLDLEHLMSNYVFGDVRKESCE
jgi:hypothetical protein